MTLTNAAASADRQNPAAANTLGAEGPPYATRYGTSDVNVDIDPAHKRTIPTAGTIQCTSEDHSEETIQVEFENRMEGVDDAGAMFSMRSVKKRQYRYSQHWIARRCCCKNANVQYLLVKGTVQANTNNPTGASKHP